MTRPLPRDPHEMTAKELAAVDRAYDRRREAVKEKAKELATNPTELMYLLDEKVAEQIAQLVRAYLAYDYDDVLHEANMLCRMIIQRAEREADVEISDVDDEMICEQMRGDHEQM